MEIFVYLGLAIFIIGGLGMLIAAFKTSLLWGLGCMFISPVSLIFLIVHWSDAKNPFFLQLVGLILLLIGKSTV